MWRGQLPAPHFRALKFLSWMLAIKNGRPLVTSLQFMGAKDLIQTVWLFYSIKTMLLRVDVCTLGLPATLSVPCGPRPATAAAAVFWKQRVITAF